jgi:hypothetical protein
MPKTALQIEATPVKPAAKPASKKTPADEPAE